MVYVPQKGMPKRILNSPNSANSLSGIERCEVVETNYSRGTVDVECRFGRFNDIPVTNFSGYDEGNDFPYGESKLPEKGSVVLMLFVRGKHTSPVVFAINKNDKKNIYKAEEFRDVDIHKSGAYRKVDKDGNYERVTPDGTFITISDKDTSAVFPTTPPSKDDLTEDVLDKIPKKDNKRVVVNHPSGTWVEIDTDGAIYVVGVSGLKGNVTGNVELDMTGNLDVMVEGNVEMSAVGDVEIGAVGAVTVTATSVTIDADTCHIKGDLITDDYTAGHTHDAGTLTVTDPVTGTIVGLTGIAADKFD